MRPSIVAMIILALGLTADPAAAGVIRGVLLTGSREAGSSEPGSSGVRGSSSQRSPGDAVVYLDAVPAKVERSLAKKFRDQPLHVTQSGLRFAPRVLAAPVGATVEFKNLDAVYHNAFSISAARRFDLGKYPPGAHRTVAFARVGVANLHCDIHPDESGFIVVVPNHAFTRPDSLGRFALPRLPEGRYTIRVWHPTLGERSRTVNMPQRGDLAVQLRW